MIHLYTGDGKGKTTAAIGLLVRAAGAGRKTYFAQFMKSGDTAELLTLSHISGVKILRCEKEFGFYNTLNDEEKRQLRQIHNQIMEELIGVVKDAARVGEEILLVLDEITYPVQWGLVEKEKLKHLINDAKENPENIEIVMTGRNPTDFLEKQADYLTRMNCVRHPYEKGISARKGIEY